MSPEIKKVLLAAVDVCRYRDGDISTEDGERATTEIDSMIELESALADTFGCEPDIKSSSEMIQKINEL